MQSDVIDYSTEEEGFSENEINTAFENNKMMQPAAPIITPASLKGEWITVSIGGTVGIVFASSAAAYADLKMTADAEAAARAVQEGAFDGQQVVVNNATLYDNFILDDHIKQASCIDERMNFDEAFAAARAEVGAGGVFGWHGNLYGTYTTREWNAMGESQREAFNEHFAWRNLDEAPITADVITASPMTPELDPTAPDLLAEKRAGQSHADDREVTMPGTEQIMSANEVLDEEMETLRVAISGTDAQEEYVAEVDRPIEAEVEQPILAESVLEANYVADAATGVDDSLTMDMNMGNVYHDAELNMNFGSMEINGQQVILTDVDGDMVFDKMGYDEHGDGNYTEVDISDQHLSVDHWGNYLDTEVGNLMSAIDETDFQNDSAE